jgi:hypothetical protein
MVEQTLRTGTVATEPIPRRAAARVSFAWLGVVVSQSGGTFGPGVPFGWPGRAEILAYSAWVMVVARQAIRVLGKPPRAEEG